MEQNNFPVSASYLHGHDGTKLTNTVYKILEALPESDPLKNRTKEKALAILENITLLAGSGGWVSLKLYLPGGREKIMLQLLDDIEILVNYLKVGKHQGWIDNMNFLIITKEYDQIKNHIKFQKDSIEKEVSLSSTISFKKEEVIAPVTASVSNSLAKENIESDKLSARQTKILEILGKVGRAQVSNFIKELPNITKRTIRRDLDDLLKRDKVVRVGEWNQVFYRINDRTET